jgi:hypothetical protein
MVIPTEMAMNDIDRFSHVVMAASPVAAPFGLTWAKLALLRLFVVELPITERKSLRPGRALPLLPPAPLPSDMAWAKPNPRIAGLRRSAPQPSSARRRTSFQLTASAWSTLRWRAGMASACR